VIAGESMIKTFAQRNLSHISFVRMVPNLATMIAMCMGLSSIRFAFMGKFDMAAGAILVAAVFDALDGRLARLLGASTEFGAELDSLSDFVSFGVAPAIVMYFYSLNVWQGFGWGVCLFAAVCTGLRLARFNILSRNPDKPSWSGKFFTGVPAPAGAMIALFPLILTHAVNDSWASKPYFVTPFVLGSGILMISRIPTFSFKQLRIPPIMVVPVLVAMGITISFLFSAPWETISVIVLLYIILIPCGYAYFRKTQLFQGQQGSSKQN
jgi:CDP-diacylglycerol--serine O-phosphatidyltransferase